METPAAEPRREEPANPLVRLAIEAGPLVVFFVANGRWDIYVGTGAFMVAVLLSALASLWTERRVPVMPLVTAVFVLVFGGLTLWLQDETFVKIKPTIVNGLFAAILLGGLLAGHSLLQPMLGGSFRLTDAAWRVLTFRWALFFVFLALVNEVVRRGFSSDFWVSFKLFGVMPLTIAFVVTQMPFIQRNQLAQEAESGSEDTAGPGD